MSVRSYLGIALLASLCLSTSLATAQVSSQECVNTEEAEKEVLALDAKRIDALLHNDVELLQSITDDNYIHVHSSGRVRSKAQFMAGRGNGSSIFSTFVIDENRATIYCNEPLSQVHITTRTKELQQKNAPGTFAFTSTATGNGKMWFTSRQALEVQTDCKRIEDHSKHDDTGNPLRALADFFDGDSPAPL